MKKISVLLFLTTLAVSTFSRPIDLYYTEDGKSIKSLRGFPMNSDFSIAENGDESWLVMVGQKIGPNGFMGKENKFTIGSLGKSKSIFTVAQEQFLGLGNELTLTRPIEFQDILYILPDAVALAPFIVKLKTGESGTLFVASQPTESPGERIIADKSINDITIIHLKYDIPRHQRTTATLPKHFGIKAMAVSFSEQGIKQAIAALNM